MKIKIPSTPSDIPNSFVAQHHGDVIGVLSGFDRIRLLASLRPLYQPSFMMSYLGRAGILLKDFGQFVSDWTQRVRIAARQVAEHSGRPLRYLGSSSQRKETLARDLARRDGVASGLIGVWTCVEPCLTYFVRRDPEAKKLVLRLERGKCLHYYFYFEHPTLGFLHLRLQTWFPFQVSVCVNGRHWLARQMNEAGIAYRQRENCFTWVEDVAKAQALADLQLKSNWPDLLKPLLNQCHPLAEEICQPLAGLSYYWSVSESEYATDVLFKSASTLAKLYPKLVRQGICHFGCADVLRFLGQKALANGHVHGNFQGEILSELKRRPEGLRLKHQANGNSIKLYDKQGSVLRVETTLNRPHQFRVYRASERDPEQKMGWKVLRKGVGDFHRRAEVCLAANHRYLEALASVAPSVTLSEVTAGICRPVIKDKRRYRALQPWSDSDGKLLEFINRGEWTVNGFRNRDVRAALYRHSGDPAEQRRQCAKVTRALARLRAHGLIKKVTGTHRYLLTDEGRRTITALLAARQANVEKLVSLAA